MKAEANTAMIIPLSQLKPSPRNVRKTGGMTIEDLAASIAAHGLLQGLVVTKNGTGYEVEAGGKRLRAMQHLVKEGKIDPDYGVPCRVVEKADALQASTAENVIRQAMHPADEFDAFKAILDDGYSISEICARFGKSERYVEQRLRLANVAPEILDEYRKGDATLEQMMALAITDDQALQLRVWKAAKNHWQRDPDELRGAITDDDVQAGSAIGRFVTLKAYEGAGGVVRRDLFGQEDDAYMVDRELVQRLAQEKLEKTAGKIRKEGWAWVEARMEFDYSERYAFGKAPSEWKGSKETWSDEAKATAGAVVTVGNNGQVEAYRGLVRPEDRKAAAKATGQEVRGGKAAKPAKKPGELSFAAVQRLQAEANGLIRAHVANEPRIALALLVAQLAPAALYNYDRDVKRVHISRDQSGRVSGPARETLDNCDGAKRLAELEEQWRSKLPGSAKGLLEWALQQDSILLGQLLAFLVAREVEVVDGFPPANRHAVDLAALVGVDLTAHWKPTEEWLSTLPKAATLAMVQDAAGKTAVAALEKLKKDQLPAQALPHFPAGWLPKVLRAPEKARKPKAVRGKRAAAGDAEDSGED